MQYKMRINYSLYFILTVFVLFIIVFSTSANAACVNARLAKTSYLPYETLQLEIDADVTRDILTSDIFLLRQDTTLPTKIFISKISSTKYFVWFDLPSQNGDYNVKIRANCNDGLKVMSVPFKIEKTVASRYDGLKNMITSWKSLSLEEHIMAAGALYFDNVSEQALQDFANRHDSCLNTACNTRLNALTLMAFDDSLLRQKMHDALEASQNTSGCWGNSANSSCDEISTAYALLALARTNRLDLNDTKTMNATTWLLNNNPSVKAKAIVYYLNKENNSNLLLSILNTQSSSGWWPKSNDYKPDIETTAIVVYVLKNSVTNETSENMLNAINNGEKWLLDQVDTQTLANKSLILFIAFSAKEIEPLLGFWPGIVKTDSPGSFDLILQNKGNRPMNVYASLLNSTTRVSLSSNEIKNLNFNVPLITTVDGSAISDNIVLNYNSVVDSIISENHGYNIPIIIFTKKGPGGINGTINSSQEIINQSEQQQIINETQNKSTENKTIGINETLLENFKFIEPSYSKDMKAGETATFTVRLKNGLDKDVTDVSIIYSSSLINGVDRIDPSFFEKILKDETKTVTVYLKPDNVRVYDGNIIATANYDGQSLSTSLPVKINASQGAAVVEKNCTEIGGSLCKDDEICEGNITTAADTFSCCIGKCNKKAGGAGTTIAIIAVVLIVVILLIIFVLLRRKPKKEMKEYLEETTKQYEKRFQRPPSIARI